MTQSQPKVWNKRSWQQLGAHGHGSRERSSSVVEASRQSMLTWGHQTVFQGSIARRWKAPEIWTRQSGVQLYLSLNLLYISQRSLIQYVHGLAHLWGAISPWPRTKTMSTKPIVTRAAPIQSTRLSVSSEGKSASIENNPLTRMIKSMPANR